MAMSSSPVFHTLPYPTIEDGSLSFPAGEYVISPKREEVNKVILAHEIKGSPFFNKLIENGEAKFGCLLSMPKTGYRKLFLANEKERQHPIEWELSITGEAPKLRPILLYTGEHDKKYTLTESDGVAEIWQGKEISIPKGARLARTSFFIANSDEHKLLKFERDETKKDGTFEVVASTEKGFYFTVKSAPDLFKFVQNNSNKNDPLRNSILTHVASRCFEILKTDFKNTEDDSWETYPNLVALSNKLEHVWDEDEFKPEIEATKMYPLRIPKPDEDDHEV